MPSDRVYWKLALIYAADLDSALGDLAELPAWLRPRASVCIDAQGRGTLILEECPPHVQVWTCLTDMGATEVALEELPSGPQWLTPAHAQRVLAAEREGRAAARAQTIRQRKTPAVPAAEASHERIVAHVHG